MRTFKKILFLLSLGICFQAHAQQGLIAPVNLPTGKVLPAGVRNLNYKGLIVNADEKYNTDGQQRALADPFFSDLTFQNMINGQHSSEDKAKLEAKMIEIGADPNDSFGSTIGQVNVSAYVNVPIFAWGLNDDTTVAMAVPIARTSINVSTGVLQTNDQLFAAFRDALSISQGGLSEFDEKFGDPVNAKLADYNYKPLTNITDTRLGDIKLVTKRRVLENKRHRLSLVGITTLPTGQQADPNMIVDIQAGDGQTDLGMGVAHDFKLSPALEFSTYFEYVNQLPDKDEKRIPFTVASKLSPDVDNDVDRDLGDMVHAQAAVQYSKNGFNAGVGYSFQYKQPDKYEGTKYEGIRYQWIGRETQQRMQAVQASLGYDTLTLFRAKKFAVPLRASLSHIQIFEGKNIVANPMTSFDLSVFF